MLDRLRQQASARQQNDDDAQATQSARNAALGKALKFVFSYLNELTKQLNILKPEVQREYPLIDGHQVSRMAWQEGFTDCRSQSQSDHAPIEQVTFSCLLRNNQTLQISRDALAYERFRTLLFDYGLKFTCDEVRNERRFIERADFLVRNELAIATRWRADVDNGQIILDTRNLERLGNMPYLIKPHLVTQELMDAFGHLLLGEPNSFREQLRRP